MKPRHLLLAVPFFLLAGCANESASQTSDAAAPSRETTNVVQLPAQGTENTQGTPENTASSDIPAWETDGPVDEAAVTARDIVLKDLDALRKSGEEMLLSNPDLSDTAIRDEVVKNSKVGSDVASEGETGIRVKATEGETSCSGLLSFTSGAGTWNSVECS